MSQIGVVSDLIKKAYAVSQRYEAKLNDSVNEHVAKTLDVRPFVNKVINQPAPQAVNSSQAVKVDISQAAHQKAAVARSTK